MKLCLLSETQTPQISGSSTPCTEISRQPRTKEGAINHAIVATELAVRGALRFGDRVVIPGATAAKLRIPGLAPKLGSHVVMPSIETSGAALRHRAPDAKSRPPKIDVIDPLPVIRAGMPI